MIESDQQSQSDQATVESNPVNDFDLIKRIIRVVEAEAGIKSPNTLLRHNRERYVSKFRDDAVYLARTCTSLSYPQLAFIFKRHHTALISAVGRAQSRRDRNPPRRDGRTWVEWHNYLIEKVKA